MLPKLFVTGTMRTGGSLLQNILSAHPKILLLSERVHFFRFVYERYNPLNNESLEYLLNDQRLRVKYRNGIELETEKLKKKILEAPLTYKNIYQQQMDYFLKESGREIWGEYAGLQWREAPVFLNWFDEGKVIHTYRDPRGVFASWKKLSSIPNNAYLNCLFNWVDSTNYVLRYSKIFSKDRYYANKYENIMNDPKKYVSLLLEFIGVEVDNVVFEPDKWPSSFSKKLVTIPRSAHEGDNILGYSTSRISNWKKNLEDWEICLADYICGKNMEQLGYEKEYKNITKDDPLLKKAISEIEKNKIVYANYLRFINTGEGTNKYPTDPTDPRSWGQKGNPSKWFVESDEGKNYMQEKAITTKELNEKFMLRG